MKICKKCKKMGKNFCFDGVRSETELMERATEIWGPEKAIEMYLESFIICPMIAEVERRKYEEKKRLKQK